MGLTRHVAGMKQMRNMHKNFVEKLKGRELFEDNMKLDIKEHGWRGRTG
jgi:hypothetical protein